MNTLPDDRLRALQILNDHFADEGNIGCLEDRQVKLVIDSMEEYVKAVPGKEEMKGLFKKDVVRLHSGMASDFKIDCDALTDKDIETLAFLISKHFRFSMIYGIPSGGLRFCDALIKYQTNKDADPVLIIDDVLTTGNSMEEARLRFKDEKTIGIVIFSRGQCPLWVTPIFQLSKPFSPSTASNEDWNFSDKELTQMGMAQTSAFNPEPKAVQAAKEYTEWQLCPKCNGDGHLGRYNSPPYMSTTVTPLCDVCNGSKILAKPFLAGASFNSDAVEFGEWQLCPRCLGEGYLQVARLVGNVLDSSCPVCNGEKLIQRPKQDHHKDYNYE